MSKHREIKKNPWRITIRSMDCNSESTITVIKVLFIKGVEHNFEKLFSYWTVIL